MEALEEALQTSKHNDNERVERKWALGKILWLHEKLLNK